MARDLSEILIVDLEATCQSDEDKKNNPNFINEIIEIGICRFNLKTLEISDLEGVIVKPQKSVITKFCTELTTLTQEDVDKGMPYQEAVSYINSKYRPRDKGWASWGDYDRKQVKRNNDLYNGGKSSLFSETHTNLKHQFSILNGYTKEFGVEKALSILNLKFEGTQHRGIDDVKNIARIWKAVLLKQRS